ncbi:decorin-like [Acyrthosiphon pisum]|uniref:Uncharacterized protein n=1 Tax=Acyrthosiphon pisum TaxID=7029 RepID=A0A8R1W8A3_ACYPI|nr:decorin-like [Acyrthosiphon pisum]|eukprot:XP_003240792.1 PREDICTED: decorin-like [Acyrthosiphon pisum]
MTWPMHQDAAAAVLRRTMVLLLLLLTFSLSSFPSVTAECLDKCRCDGAEIYCNFMKLDRIPDRISPDTEFLDLRYNLIRNIPPGIFDSLTSLSYLTLNDNQISNLKNGAFANLSKLQTL